MGDHSLKPIVVVGLAVAAALLITTHAKAQPATSSAPPAAATKSAKSGPLRCMRLPLSDVAFGKDGAIKAAREKLNEYAALEAKLRRWPEAPLVRSNETIGACTVYLDFGPLIGTEYRCLVTATFCQK